MTHQDIATAIEEAQDRVRSVIDTDRIGDLDESTGGSADARVRALWARAGGPALEHVAGYGIGAVTLEVSASPKVYVSANTAPGLDEAMLDALEIAQDVDRVCARAEELMAEDLRAIERSAQPVPESREAKIARLEADRDACFARLGEAHMRLVQARSEGV